jgi:hypothetical protein
VEPHRTGRQRVPSRPRLRPDHLIVKGRGKRRYSAVPRAVIRYWKRAYPSGSIQTAQTASAYRRDVSALRAHPIPPAPGAKPRGVEVRCFPSADEAFADVIRSTLAARDLEGLTMLEFEGELRVLFPRLRVSARDELAEFGAGFDRRIWYVFRDGRAHQG